MSAFECTITLRCIINYDVMFLDRYINVLHDGLTG